ncbi:MAG TPA: PD-(D/E)XK nuclease-like domain-containing protein [Jiangellaceae bacterium]|nr:PD-(D/E)XK nuclease-like domain-containing protein [Jiangellaceae bacterium]
MIDPGIHAAVPSESYHRRELGIVSKSALDRVRRSPAHYKSWLDGELPDEDSPALAFGRAFHMALLEPERFASTYVELPRFDRRTKEGKAAAAAWDAEHAGAEPIRMDDLLCITAMVESVKTHPLAGKMVRDGKPELTLSWKDSGTGLRCKSRLDYYVQDLSMIVDAKTTEDASWEAFRRDVVKYGYHRQDALYRAAALALDLPVQHFVLLAVEKRPPYAVACYTLDAQAIGLGYGSVRRDIETLAECVRTNRFPGYPETIRELDLPPWVS